jgi:hypothetical protein
MGTPETRDIRTLAGVGASADLTSATPDPRCARRAPTAQAASERAQGGGASDVGR